ncbi:hypothetical protein ASE04_21110 [Rhizobium sp. Root708]|uniref:hypothetical protein n=1 Tax=Rhizobium sp. Root708 TaxID=1736592 RepID=UPI0006F3986E|nr:hypothetical protein [Rhizobium sp. Root708]KRB61372.1 hypothetical protein ASE04_21110 [Rhizobium sp. Root708]
MTGADHEHTDAAVVAAQWLAEQNPAPQPIIPIMRERFGLTPLEASEACALANKFRVCRKAFG